MNHRRPKKILTEAGQAYLRRQLLKMYEQWLIEEMRRFPMALGMEVMMEYTSHFHIGVNADPSAPELTLTSDSPLRLQ
jgi:hypothetical protein